MTVCYARDDKLIACSTGEILTTPAILIDVDSDLLIKWGKAEDIAKEHEVYKATPLAPSITMVTLEQLSAEEQAYVINRMMNYTATDFVKNFARESSGDGAVDWLHSEMKRIPA